MKNENYITSFCTISNGMVNLNHSVSLLVEKTEDKNEQLKHLYKQHQLSYPKFYKMDSLCKLAFIASELLLKDQKITEKYASEDIAIVIANRSSSLEIDTQHQATIAEQSNYFPSPSIFVYTLANILVGEIAIRNKIKGENTFFIFDKFDASFMSTYINSLLDTNRATCCIGGWVEFYDNNYNAFLYLVEKENGKVNNKHTAEYLNQLSK